MCSRRPTEPAAAPSNAALQLALRGINTAKSAFLALYLRPGFFELYEVRNATVVQTSVLLKVRACGSGAALRSTHSTGTGVEKDRSLTWQQPGHVCIRPAELAGGVPHPEGVQHGGCGGRRQDGGRCECRGR